MRAAQPDRLCYSSLRSPERSRSPTGGHGGADMRALVAENAGVARRRRWHEGCDELGGVVWRSDEFNLAERAVCGADAGQESWIHGGGRADAGAGHRREYRDFFGGVRGAAEAAAVSRAGSPGDDRRRPLPAKWRRRACDERVVSRLPRLADHGEKFRGDRGVRRRRVHDDRQRRAEERVRDDGDREFFPRAGRSSGDGTRFCGERRSAGRAARGDVELRLVDGGLRCGPERDWQDGAPRRTSGDDCRRATEKF